MSERTLFPIPQPYPQQNNGHLPSLKEMAAAIRSLHEEGLLLLLGSMEKFWLVGQILQQVKQHLGHGKFEEWVEKNCPFAMRTAQKYLKVFTDHENLEAAKAHERALLEISAIGKQLAQDAQPEPPPPPPPTPEQEDQARSYVNENAVESLVELMQAKRISPADALKISRLTDAEQQAASIHIQSNGTVCASDHVDTLIKEITGTRATSPVKDCLGAEVPKRLRDVFADETALDFVKELQSFFRTVKKDRARFFFFHRREFFKACGDLEALVEESLPHSLCGCCRGKGRAKGSECRRCLGQGYVSTGVYQDELKEPDWEGAK